MCLGLSGGHIAPTPSPLLAYGPVPMRPRISVVRLLAWWRAIEQLGRGGSGDALDGPVLAVPLAGGCADGRSATGTPVSVHPDVCNPSDSEHAMQPFPSR